MTVNERENIRHAEERGAILSLLAEDFGEEMSSASGLLHSLDMLGYPVSGDGFAFHMRYLQAQGYIQIWRTRDMAGYRADRVERGSPNDIRFARLLPKGVQLVNGQIEADPAVRFA